MVAMEKVDPVIIGFLIHCNIANELTIDGSTGKSIIFATYFILKATKKRKSYGVLHCFPHCGNESNENDSA